MVDDMTKVQPDQARVQRQLRRVAPESKVSATFVVTDEEDPTIVGGAPYPDGLFGELVAISAIALAVRYLYKAVQARSLFWYQSPRHVVAVTSTGVALGRLSPRPWAGRVKEWVHLPSEGLRYELDPSEVSSAKALVEISIAATSYWAQGPQRDLAYRYFARQSFAAELST